VVAGCLGLKLAMVNVSATAVWLPTGIAMAALLVGGLRAWPVVTISAFLVNILTPVSMIAAAGISIGNTLEAVVGALLVTRFARGRQAFSRPQDISAFVALAALSAVVSASIGVGTLLATGLAGNAPRVTIWLTWWLGDAIGAVTATPLFLLWIERRRAQWTPGRVAEVIALGLALVAFGSIAFGPFPSSAPGSPLKFVCLPVILWSAFRFGQRGVVLANLVLLAMAVDGSLHGPPAQDRTEANRALLLLQCYLGVTAVTGLVIAAVVAERQRLQHDLADKAEALVRSNRELEQYAYVASHDLQEPLRLVTSYSELLARRYREKLDEQGRGYVDTIVGNTTRMRDFIRGLLEYSRLGRDADRTEAAPLGAMLDEVRASLQVGIAEAGAEITADELPTIACNRLEMRQVLQNLIANALKFRASRPPRIHIGARADRGGWVITVRDNGPGIDPAGAERLFEMFHRSASASAVPGAGIGLAVCKKVVERHGGRIWVEPSPGGGATFAFSIPEERVC
jgi:signal transduction histidine kinase